MPNGDHYRSGASRCRTLAEQYLRQSALLAGWPVAGHLGDGPAADAVADALARASAHLRTAADDLGRIAAECTRRAAICDQYRADLRRWLLTGSFVGPAPLPPYPWVSVEVIG